MFDSPRPPSARLTCLVGLAAGAIGGLILAIGGAAYAWDGSFFLEQIINRGAPFAPDRRWSDYLWEAPTWSAVRITHDAVVAQWTFRFTTAFLPLAAIGASWLVVRRKRPDLIIWAIVGVCGCCLPGQWFSVAEGIIAIQFAWPLFLAIAVGLEGWTELAAVALSVFIFFQHPFASPIFLGAGLALAVGQISRLLPAAPRWRWWVVALMGAAVVRRELVTGNERGYATLSWLRQSTSESMYHLPLLAMGALLAAAAVMIVARAHAWLPAVLIAMATVALCVHFARVSHWTLALSYRLPVLFVTAPFVLLMFLAAARRGEDRPLTPFVVSVATGVMFIAVLFVQALAWRHVLDDVQASVRFGPACKTLAAVDDGRGTPITHWATSYLAILQQPRHPRRFLAGSEAGCHAFEQTGHLFLRPWAPHFAEPSGFYELP